MVIFKQIQNAPNYFVSDNGDVKSNYLYHNSTQRILKPRKNKYGYLQLEIKIGGLRRFKNVRRLVAETFVLNPFNKPQVNHKDGNKENNSVENLEWVTHSENMQHSVKKGLHKVYKGTNHCNSKLSNKNIIDIKIMLQNKKPQHLIAKKHGVSQVTISKINNGKSYVD